MTAYDPRSRITPHQLEVLLARWQLGSDAAAAQRCGISRNTAKNILYTIRWHLHAEDTNQATYILREQLMELEAQQEVTEKLATVRKLRKAS